MIFLTHGNEGSAENHWNLTKSVANVPELIFRDIFRYQSVCISARIKHIDIFIEGKELVNSMVTGPNAYKIHVTVNGHAEGITS